MSRDSRRDALLELRTKLTKTLAEVNAALDALDAEPSEAGAS
jgi:hypothetical protein